MFGLTKVENIREFHIRIRFESCLEKGDVPTPSMNRPAAFAGWERAIQCTSCQHFCGIPGLLAPELLTCLIPHTRDFANPAPFIISSHVTTFDPYGSSNVLLSCIFLLFSAPSPPTPGFSCLSDHHLVFFMNDFLVPLSGPPPPAKIVAGGHV